VGVIEQNPTYTWKNPQGYYSSLSYVSYIKWLYVFCIPKIPQGGYYRFLLCILYKEALYNLYPNSTRVLCLMYPIKWLYVFCTPKFHKGTIIILCILIRGFRCILYPKFQRVLRYLMYPMRLYVFCTCLYPQNSTRVPLGI